MDTSFAEYFRTRDFVATEAFAQAGMTASRAKLLLRASGFILETISTEKQLVEVLRQLNAGQPVVAARNIWSAYVSWRNRSTLHAYERQRRREGQTLETRIAELLRQLETLRDGCADAAVRAYLDAAALAVRASLTRIEEGRM